MGFSSLVISLFRAHCQSNSIIQIDRRERVKINHTKQLKMCKKCCVCFAGGTSQGSQFKMIKCSKCSKSSGGTSQGDPNDSLTEEDCREGSGGLGLLISFSLSHFDWDYWYLPHYPILIEIIDTFLIIPFRLGYLYLSHYLSLRFPSPFDIDNDLQRELFIMQSYANAETQARQKI